MKWFENMELKKKIGTKEVHFEKCGNFPCDLEVFTIDGVDAVKEDFIRHEQVYPACFLRCYWKREKNDDEAIERTKEKYSLSSEEFDGIYELLEKNLVSFCVMCFG